METKEKMEAAQPARSDNLKNYAPQAVDYRATTKTSEKITVKPAFQSSNAAIKPSESSLDPFIGVNRLPLGSVKLSEFLGKGAFGQIYQGRWGKRVVALKEIEVKLAQEKLGISETEVLEALQWEVSRLSTSSHPNLVQFYGIYQDEGKTYLVMEFCENGNLQNTLRKNLNLGWSIRWQWALEITQGLAYLHHEGMLHRDLKAENILLDRHNRARLADLGVAQVDALLQQKEASVVEKGFQDQRFIAPEILTQSGSINAASDIYALGLVFWQLVNEGKDPRRAKDSNELLEWMKSGEREPIPEECRAEFRALILDCWQLDPSKRPSAEQIISRLYNLAQSFQSDSHWIKLCETIDVQIHPIRSEGIRYIAPYVTQHRVEENLDAYWQLLEFESNSKTQDQKKLEEELKIGSEQFGNPPLELNQTFTQFLQSPNASTLVLLGESGLGKTLSVYQLADRLLSEWWNYLKNPKNDLAPYLPIFIRSNLSYWSHSELKDGLDKVFKRYELEMPLSTFKNARWLFIVDGYDECEADVEPKNLAEQLGIIDFPNAKVIVTSRSETVKAKELQNRFSSNGDLIVRYFLPFNITQLLDYLERNLCWDSKIYNLYREKFKSLHDLRGVLRNPFILSLLVQSWQTVSKKDFNQLNRWQIYKTFIDHWIETNQVLLPQTIQQRLSIGTQNLLESFNIFAAEIAFSAFQHKSIFLPIEVVDALSPNSKNWANLKKYITEDSQANFKKRQENLTEEARRRALLTEQDYTLIKLRHLRQFEAGSPLKSGTKLFQFGHKSFFEYFVAQRVVQLRNKDSKSIVDECLELLNHRPIQAEPETLRFMEEAWQETETRRLIDPLFQIMKLSPGDHSITQSSANAATILNVGNIPFSGMNLNGILIPGADLSGAILDHTQLQGADLARVILHEAWLYKTNLSGALMPGVEFWEWPSRSLPDSSHSCCYSRDTRWLAVATGRTIYLYDAFTRMLVRTFEGHTGDVTCVAFHPNSTLLASGSVDNTVKLWEVKKSVQLRKLEHPDSIRCLAFSLDGTQLAVGNSDYKMKNPEDIGNLMDDIMKQGKIPDRLIDVNTGFIKMRHQEMVEVTYNTLQLWEVPTGRLLRPLRFPVDKISQRTSVAVNSVAFHPDGIHLVSGNEDTTVRLWDITTGKLVRTFNSDKIGGGRIKSIALHPDGTRLASGTENNIIRLWDIATAKHLRTFEGHTNSVTSVAYHPDGELLASGSNDKTLKLWNASTGYCLRTLRKTDCVTNITFHPEGRQLAFVNGKFLRFWEVKPDAYFKKFERGHKERVTSIFFHPNGIQFFSASEDKSIRLWDIATGKLMHVITPEDRGIVTAFHSYDKEIVYASISFYQKLELYEVGINNPLKVKTFEGEVKDNRVNCAAFHPNGLQLVTGGFKDNLLLWDIKTGKILRTFSGHNTDPRAHEVSNMRETARSQLFNPHPVGSLATGADWMALTRQMLNTKPLVAINEVRFHPNGLYFASGSQDSSIRLWEIETGKCLKIFEGQKGGVESLDFHPNGTCLASGSIDDKLVRLWDIATGNCVRIFKGHKSGVNIVSFHPDGLLLASVGFDTTFKLWNILTGKCVFSFSNKKHIKKIAWHQKNSTTFLTTGDEDGCVCYWQILNSKQNIGMQLFWSSHQTELYTIGACLEDARNLSEDNMELFKQQLENFKELVMIQELSTQDDAERKDGGISFNNSSVNIETSMTKTEVFTPLYNIKNNQIKLNNEQDDFKINPKKMTVKEYRKKKACCTIS